MNIDQVYDTCCSLIEWQMTISEHVDILLSGMPVLIVVHHYAKADILGMSKRKKSAGKSHKPSSSQPHRQREQKHAVVQQNRKNEVLSNTSDIAVPLSRGLINTLFMLTNAPVFPDITTRTTHVKLGSEGRRR